MMALALMLALVSAAEDDTVTSTAPTVTSAQKWSVVGGRTVGANDNAIEAGAGWPGLSVGYSRGVLANLDLGVRVSFTYGIEGLIRELIPGGKVQGLLKFRLAESGPISVGLVFEPGPWFAVDRFGNGRAGFSFPIGVRLGLAVSSAVNLGFSFDVPMWVEFGTRSGFNLPLMPGLGLEYFIKSEFLAFFKTRMGPTIRGGFVELTLDAQLGIGYRF
jgi:hypothetical protein